MYLTFVSSIAFLCSVGSWYAFFYYLPLSSPKKTFSLPFFTSTAIIGVVILLFLFFSLTTFLLLGGALISIPLSVLWRGSILSQSSCAFFLLLLCMTIRTYSLSLLYDTHRKSVPDALHNQYVLVQEVLEPKEGYYRYILSTEQTDILPCLQIMVYSRKNGWLLPSDRCRITYLQLSTPSDPGFLAYCKRSTLHATAFTTTYWYTDRARPVCSLARWCFLIRKRAWGRIRRVMSAETATLFKALFLGNKDEGPYEAIRPLFQHWGLSHYLARSGMHIMMLIWIWSFFIGFFPGWHIQTLLCVILLTFYAFFSWSSLSFIRALFCAFITLGSGYWYYPAHPLYTLHTVAFLTLAWNPFSLLGLDFQLSYGITTAILLYVLRRKRESVAPT